MPQEWGELAGNQEVGAGGSSCQHGGRNTYRYGGMEEGMGRENKKNKTKLNWLNQRDTVFLFFFHILYYILKKISPFGAVFEILIVCRFDLRQRTFLVY